jgi:hypothetical protein
MKYRLELGLAGPDLTAILEALVTQGLPRKGEPIRLTVDASPKKPAADWLARGLKCKVEFMARWDDAWISMDRDRVVKISMDDCEFDPAALLKLIETLPVTLVSAGSIHDEWEDGSLGEKYLAPGFGDLHWSHGPFCAFKEAGHERLVSRRWLEYGPWKLLRGNADVSLVQFHELGADAKTALQQARPGHERMGISPAGGFIQQPFPYRYGLKGRYLPALRKLDFVVNGRPVPELEMLEAAASRHDQILGAQKPIESVAYTFVVEEEARDHLHELWLHGLECWAIIEGKEVRLDEDYHPDASPPGWVKQGAF